MHTSKHRIIIALAFSFVLNLILLNTQAIFPSKANSTMMFIGLGVLLLTYGLLCLNSIRRLSLLPETDYNQKYLDTYLEMAKFIPGNDDYIEKEKFTDDIEQVEFNYWVDNKKAPIKSDINLNH